MIKLFFFSVKILLLALVISFVYISCKKIDTTPKAELSFPVNWEEKFFMLPENPKPAIVRIANEMKKQNKQSGFLEKFVKEQGFINWEKADIIVKMKKKNIHALENGGTDTLVLLPTVPWMQEIVKSIVAAKLDGDVSFKTYLDKFYAENGFNPDQNREKPNASDVVSKIMEFEIKIFGDAIYKVEDKRLFSVRPVGIIKPESFFVKMIEEEECTLWMETVSSDGGETWEDTGYEWTEGWCEDESSGAGGWVPDPDPSVGGGGGTSDPPDDSSPQDCVPWYRLREANGGYDVNTPKPCVEQPPPPIIDTVPNPCDQADSLAKDIALTRMMDTLKMQALDSTNRSENGYVYVTNDSGGVDYAYLRGDTGMAGLDFTLNFPVEGYLHSHYSGLLSIFSPDDLWSLCKIYNDSNMLNPLTYTAFVTTAAGTNYILKIEDIDKFKTFADNLTTGDFGLYYDAYGKWWGIKKDNSIDVNERYFLKYLDKTNGGSGLKLFRGNDTFTEWTPLGLDRDGNVAEVPCE